VKYKAVKGVQDVLPPEVSVWQRLEDSARRVFGAYGFREIRPPIMESTEVFTRSIGETSDIVEKEMYTFSDKGGRSVSLRPEGTAPIVRAYVEHHLHTRPVPQKFYYFGPMFRYERPQKGRLRQFYQIGVEAFGIAGPAMDAEVISMLGVFLEMAGLGGLGFEINSIGCPRCRPGYRAALIEYFTPGLDGLCPDCKRRLSTNPLRILDCKAAGCRQLRKGAPVVSDYLCEDCESHFGELKALLAELQVSFRVNPEMVRGLDYYTRTTFEVTSEDLGAQNAVAAGGRYDGLVREFGGPDTPAIGFALGMERLVALAAESAPEAPAVFIASLGEEASRAALGMADRLRSGGVWVELGYGSGSLKSQMRRADKSGADYVFVIGEDEIRKGTVNWKNLKDGTSGETGVGEAHGVIRG
jgi:histidyl-tRNA synthetase